ncbi:SMP-30/gluconolactonase/LRE family protein [Sphingomonas cannabina]|uniref:SMP-30/gluconolactonase/LRE family protein n=1 Tax=Sphingomonas cannabina TaxID=2899123 RepID=UPI001F42640B|nr:SMP-30/gluconolactonase/LRE family protein [Sphingomonas cannabina]UIJ46038.1 SMP-30/gluconolactonase/LRE family protein [Sphingomonas cannabina]
MQANLVWSVSALLGEGPIWLPADEALWFVDIKQDRLHRFVPESGERETFHVDNRPSFAVPAAAGGLILGTGRELVRFEDGAVVERLATIPMPVGNRTNDATVDPEGRLWFGTMDDGERDPSGRVYRFDGTLTEMGCACTITNGPAVSPDGRWLYHVDTLAGQVWRYDIGGDPDRLENGELFVTIAPDDGHPDGVTCDAEGCLWVALWGGWGVRRYSPEGELIATVALPCAQVTKVAFGGPDLRTGYVTTASVGLSADALAAQPLAGGLFAFEAPAPGLPPNVVR